MKVTADTNVLIRAMTGDDAKQSHAAKAELDEADIVAITLEALCELVWVLGHGYRIRRLEIAAGIRRLVGAANVAIDRAAVEAGLTLLEAGGDFADGVIAHEGRWLGGETFLTFDKDAAKLLARRGEHLRVL